MGTILVWKKCKNTFNLSVSSISYWWMFDAICLRSKPLRLPPSTMVRTTVTVGVGLICGGIKIFLHTIGLVQSTYNRNIKLSVSPSENVVKASLRCIRCLRCVACTYFILTKQLIYEYNIITVVFVEFDIII